MRKRPGWTLFITMIKIGLLGFGGDSTMIPMLEDEFVRRQKWFSEEEMVSMVALSHVVPGPTAINRSILIGHRISGTKGALIAVAGTILPSVVIMTAVTLVYQALSENPYVAATLRGIRAAVVGLLVSVLLRFAKPFSRDIAAITVFAAAFAASLMFPTGSIFIILAAALIGVVAGIWRIKRTPPNNEV